MHRLKSQPLDAVSSLEVAADHASVSFDDPKAASLLRAAIRTLQRAQDSKKVSADGLSSLTLSVARLQCKLAETLRLLGSLDESLTLAAAHDRHDHPALAASSLLTVARCHAQNGDT